MVYSGVVSRTQVYLGVEELELLDQAAQATGASRSALIRRAVRESFGTRTKADRLRALRASAGSWKGRSFTGAEYVDEIRGDLNDRLQRLGLQ
jgi:Arc/MetJ-type ribon-helix-helix transcriptional regulator